MTVKAYLTNPFSTTHENRIYDDLLDELERVWGKADDEVYYFGNFYCQGSEIDAAVLKRDSITVIDFKNYGGSIHFSENGRWTADGVDIKGGSKTNPYQQIRDNKFALLECLKKFSPLPSRRQPNYGHISGMVLFQQPIIFNVRQIPSKLATWFDVTDLDHAVGRLKQITSKQINLTDDDLSLIVRKLKIPEYERVGTRVKLPRNIKSVKLPTPEDYKYLRSPYIPSNIRAVIIAESPPDSGKYFYNPDGDTNEPLFSELMRTLIGEVFATKHDGLTIFCEYGWLLLDGTYEQVNHRKDRNTVLKRDYPKLKREIEDYGITDATPLILIKANVCALLEPLLSEDGYLVANLGRVIYYPSSGQQGRFREQIKPILEENDLTPSL